MIPQFGCYQNTQRNGGMNYRNNKQSCGVDSCNRSGCDNRGGFPGSVGSNYAGNSAYRGGGNPSARTRAPPVFASQSCGNYCPSPSNGNRQQTSWGNSCARPRQGTGRSNQFQLPNSNRSNINPRENCQYQQCQQPRPAQPATMAPKSMPGTPDFCTPQAIKVNVTAEQLENAKNVPIYQDRGEPSQAGNGNVKYIQLNWQDLLGGMENLRVSMAPPSSDPNCQNRQLKVSFGGQRTDPAQAGETPLKVLSIQPAGTTERMELQKGNAFAGRMKVCNSPIAMRMSPTQASQTVQNGGSYYRQNESGNGYRSNNCRY